MEDPKKLKIESPYDPEIPLLGKNKKQNPKTKKKKKKTLIQKDTCTPIFIATLLLY